MQKDALGGPEGAALAHGLARSAALAVVSLRDNGIGVGDPADDFVTALARGLGGRLPLDALDLSHNTVRTRGAGALADAVVRGAVRSLALACNAVLCRGGVALACATRAPSSCLAVLNLADNGICCEGAEGVARAMAGGSTLVDLDLSLNAIGVRGKRAFVAALRTPSRLRRLNLFGQGIGGGDAADYATPDALVQAATVRDGRLCSSCSDVREAGGGRKGAVAPLGAHRRRARPCGQRPNHHVRRVLNPLGFFAKPGRRAPPTPRGRYPERDAPTRHAGLPPSHPFFYLFFFEHAWGREPRIPPSMRDRLYTSSGSPGNGGSASAWRAV